jgi:hypothetical protein
MCRWRPELAAALAQLEIRRYLIIDSFDRRGAIESAALAGFDKVYQISSFDSLEELAAIAGDLLVSGAVIDTVLSHHEFSQLGAAYLEQLLVRDPAALRHSAAQRDKRLMKARVQQHGVATAKFVSFAEREDPDALAEVARRLSFPVVLKPAMGFGTMDTMRVDTFDELAEIVGGHVVNPLIRSKQLVVEEFISGREVCVDALWHEGRCVSFVVHEYLQPKLQLNERTTDAVPVVDGSCVLDPAANAALYRELRDLQMSVNEALGIRRGATHMEVFVKTDGGVVFGEIANRIGGIWIPMMLSEYFGCDIWRALVEAQIFGDGPPTKTGRRCVGGVNIRPSSPGVITAMPTAEELSRVDGVLRWAVATGAGSRARLAHPAEQYLMLVIAATDHADFKERCGRLEDQLVVQVADLPGRA